MYRLIIKKKTTFNMLCIGTTKEQRKSELGDTDASMPTVEHAISLGRRAFHICSHIDFGKLG